MSKAGKKLIHPPQNEYGDRRTIENENFPDLTVRLEHIESLLLLLDSEEELVLISILKHLTDYVRKDDNNISLLKEHHVLELLMRKGFYRSSPNAIIRRFSLYLIANIVETMNTLVDLETNETMELVRLSLEYFVEEEDEFCQEFLSVVINKCLDDPQVANNVLQLRAYVEKFFHVTTKSYNPDVIFHSLELLEKLLRVLSSEDLLEFIAQSSFPVCRVLCELSSEFVEIRRAALKVVRILVLVIRENNPLYKERRKVQVMEQLTKMFCQNLTDLESDLVVDVLASAMRNEPLAHIFFEHNFFELLIEHFEHMEYEGLCKSLSILCEAANYGKYLPRLSEAGATEILLRCFLDNDGAPSTHILMGLNRLIKHADACKRIVESFDRGIIKILLGLLRHIEYLTHFRFSDFYF